MSNSVICRGGRASTLAPLLPLFVTTKPAFESLESDFRTKVGSAFTLSARIADVISSPRRKPREAMMCAATVNWTLFTDIPSPTHYVMLNSTISYIQFFAPRDRPGLTMTETDRSHTTSKVLCVSIQIATSRNFNDKGTELRLRRSH